MGDGIGIIYGLDVVFRIESEFDERSSMLKVLMKDDGTMYFGSIKPLAIHAARMERRYLPWLDTFDKYKFGRFGHFG